MWPTNEAETINLYKLMQEYLNWRIVHLQVAFPDAVIENRNGTHLVAEFEHLAKNFQQHGHDPGGCDLIVCWHNNWPGAPLPVWALQDCMIPIPHRRTGSLRETVRQLRNEHRELRYKIGDLRQENRGLKAVARGREKLRFEVAGTFEIAGVGTLYVNTERDLERMGMFLSLIFRLPEGRAIQDWMRTADIPNKTGVRRLVRRLSSEP